MVISLIFGWGVAHYYYRRQLEDLREENGKLNRLLKHIQRQLYGVKVENIRKLIADYRLIPRNLLDDFAGDARTSMGLYNEAIMYAQDQLEKRLREVIGEDYWQDFSLALNIALYPLMGEPISVRQYLLNLKNYVFDPTPISPWYDALSTALYHTKKFPQIGVPLHSPYGGEPVKIIRANKEDLFLLMDEKVKCFADDAYQQLRRIALEHSPGINIHIQNLERLNTDDSNES